MASGRWRAAPALAVLAVLAVAGCAEADPPEPTAVASTTPAARPAADPTPTGDVTALAVEPPGPSATPAPTPVHRGAVHAITDELAARMATSWREGCPVPLADLRYLSVPFVDLTGAERTGELVVHADVAEGVLDVFATLHEARSPVASMRLVDDFAGSDDASMAADNTSAFNCRAITGGTAWSEHAYGRAIDFNPVENPYVRGSHVAPDAGEAFVDRPQAPGVVHDGDVVVQAFAAIGWVWGGTWTGAVLDYQHFSRTGR